jgi:outer membrane lipoprotein-sorting protein
MKTIINKNRVPRWLRCVLPVILVMLMAATALADLPSGEKVIKEHLKAMGGKKAIGKHHNSLMKGKMLMSGIELSMTMYSGEPNLRYMLLESPMIGKMESGSDGKVAWELSMMQGASVKEGEELTKALFEARFNSELYWKERHESIEVEGIEEVDGAMCYKVLLTPKVGDPVTNYYDKSSYLAVKTEVTINSQMGSITVVSFTSDYREVDGVLTPFHNKTILMGAQEMVTVFETVEFNVDVPAGTFDLPQEIQALLTQE